MKRETIKSILIVVLFIGILIVGGFYFGKHGNHPAGFIQQQVLPGLTQKSIQEETDLYTIDVKYPEFTNVSAEFNDAIRMAAIGGIEEFKETARADYDVRLGYASTPEEAEAIKNNPWKYYYNAEYEIIQLNENYISVRAHQGGFTGGAHGYDVIHTFNYDVNAQKTMALSDFYPNDPNYLATLSEISRTQLRDKLGEWVSEDFLLPGTEPILENFSEFTFTNPDLSNGKSTITIYFQQYQVGPYAIGQQTVEIQTTYPQ
jgi:hypothetical protein